MTSNIDISKLPPLDSIAALLADKIFALTEEEATEDFIIELLTSEKGRMIGRIKRNAHSFILIFSDNSCLRVDIRDQGFDIHVGQYAPDPTKTEITEVHTDVPFVPSNQTKH